MKIYNACRKKPYGRHKPMKQNHKAACGRPYAIEQMKDRHNKTYHSEK